MKKVLPIIASVVLFAACQTEQKKDVDVNKDFMLMDTARIYPNSVSSDTGIATVNTTVPPTVAQPSAPMVRQTTTPRRQNSPRPVPQNNAPVVQAPQPVPTPSPVPAPTSTAGTGTAHTDTAAVTPAAKKKGWSEAAKGATVGGVGGAVVGAVIGKNAKGAAIGAVIGAAGGYILGRKKDKASGRVDTTKN